MKMEEGLGEECGIGGACRAVARAEEDLSPYLGPTKQSYVFGSLAPQAARFIMWLLPDLQVLALSPKPGPQWATQRRSLGSAMNPGTSATRPPLCPKLKVHYRA